MTVNYSYHLSKSFSNSVVRAFPAKKEKKPHRVKIQFSLGIPLFFHLQDRKFIHFFTVNQ